MQGTIKVPVYLPNPTARYLKDMMMQFYSEERAPEPAAEISFTTINVIRQHLQMIRHRSLTGYEEHRMGNTAP